MAITAETLRSHFAIQGKGILVTGMISPKGFGQVTVDAKSSGVAAARRVERLLQSFPGSNGRGTGRYFTYFVGPLPKNALSLIEAAVGKR